VKRVCVYYSGRVQGVGFRFTAERIANSLGARGLVKNLPDGRVHIIAEADEGVLKDFLEEINRHLSRYVEDVDIKWQEAQGGFVGFNVAF
jgi:acylphosphatase